MAFLQVRKAKNKSGLLKWFITKAEVCLYFSRSLANVFKLLYAWIGASYPFADRISRLINLYRRLLSFLCSSYFFFWNLGESTRVPSSFSKRRPFSFLKSDKNFSILIISNLRFLTSPSSWWYYKTTLALVSFLQI